MSAGCVFRYSLAATPIITQITPSSGEPGTTLSISGHHLSTTAAENVVTVGGRPCTITGATADSSYSVPSCPVTSCTREMQTKVTLACTLPSLASATHTIEVSTLSGGVSNGVNLALPGVGASFHISPIVTVFTPKSGSVGGGTTLTITGGGLSERVGDIDVLLGTSRCHVLTAAPHQVTCITGTSADLTATVSVALSLRVSGQEVLCTASPCTYSYSLASTSVLTAATVVASSTSQWSIRVDGRFTSALDVSDARLRIGEEETTTTSVSTTQIQITLAPPLSGPQTISLLSSEGVAIGEPALPTITGTALSVTSSSPSSMSLAGGAELSIRGAGFSSSLSTVSVCGRSCAVTAVTSTTLKCTAPSTLLHASGVRATNLTNASEAVLELSSGAFLAAGLETTVQKGRRYAFAFDGFSADNLPRGSTIASVHLLVTPHSGAKGAVIADVGASLHCAGALPMDTTTALAAHRPAATVEWDMQPYDTGAFATNKSPNLASLVSNAIGARATLDSCALMVLVDPKMDTQGHGARTFYSPLTNVTARRPTLRISYAPPPTSAQLEWTTDSSCAIDVSVPMPIAPGGTCTAYDASASKEVKDVNSCDHLFMAAQAATSAVPCALSVNGLDVMPGCGLDRLVEGRDGVCAVVVDPPHKPRAMCFDTRTPGVGAPQLASWIDTLAHGATVALASCSRFAWRYDRDGLATALAMLGATDTPTYLDDAYALVGVKGASAPIAESRTMCCTTRPTTPCQSCNETVASASGAVACGAAAPPLSSLLASYDYVYNEFGSSAYVAAVGALSDGAAQVSSTTAVAITTATGALASMQANDVDQLDMQCETALTTDGLSVRHGALLATDGDASSYWFSAGRPDAVLTIDLGATQLVRRLTFDWQYPASTLLVLYSTSATGSSWLEVEGSSVYLASTPPAAISLLGSAASDKASGHLMRRLRLYMANATDPANPMFGLRELGVEGCTLPLDTASSPMALAYSRALTPTVTSVSPMAGSTAGGTALTIAVTGLPSSTSTSDVTVTIAGVACAVTAVSATTVSCTTGSYGVTSAANPGSGYVHLTIANVGTAAATKTTLYEYIDLWSRRTTWGGAGATIPGLETEGTQGDSIWIQKGQRIRLDCDIKVYMMIIQGTLEFARQDINVEAYCAPPPVKAIAATHQAKPSFSSSPALMLLGSMCRAAQISLSSTAPLSWAQRQSPSFSGRSSRSTARPSRPRSPCTAPRCSRAASARSTCMAGRCSTGARTQSSPRRRAPAPRRSASWSRWTGTSTL